MQCACAILSSVACPALQYFFTFSRKRHDFRGEKSYLNIKCVFRFSVQFSPEALLILRRIQRYIIISVYRSSNVKYEFDVNLTVHRR